jgi:hypothetical protein
MRLSLCFSIVVVSLLCLTQTPEQADAGSMIYLSPERLVYPFPLDEEIQIIGYLREVATGTPVDIEVSLELPGGDITYLDPALEFHSTRTAVLAHFPFVAVPTSKLFTTDGSRIFAGGDATAIGELPAGRYILKTSLSGNSVSDSSEAAFFLVAEELLPSIAETPRPIIDALDPPYGAPGARITIHGRKLRGDPNLVDPALIDRLQIKSTLNGQELPILDMDEDGEWLDVVLPSNASSGDLLVNVTLPYWDELALEEHLTIPMVAVFTSNAFPFYVRPEITSIGDATVYSGQSLIITGRNFSGDAASDQVLFDDTPGTVTEASETALTVTVPSLETDGVVRVVVVSNGIPSLPAQLFLNRPRLYNWYPRTLVPGDILTVTGRGFSATAGENVILLGDVALPILSETENKITAATGTSLIPGLFALKVIVNGASSGEEAFVTVLPAWR